MASRCSTPCRIAWSLTFASVSSSALAQGGNEQAAIEAARRGGVVIACRHGKTDSFEENEMTLVYDDSSTQRRLNAAGERQAMAMGEAFAKLSIRATDVIASPMQRARRTAELMFGRATLDSSWHTRGSNYSGPKQQLRQAALSTPVPGGNRIIVSHLGTLGDAIKPTNPGLAEGDCVVVRPEGSGFAYIGKVTWRGWITASEQRR